MASEGKLKLYFVLLLIGFMLGPASALELPSYFFKYGLTGLITVIVIGFLVALGVSSVVLAGMRYAEHGELFIDKALQNPIARGFTMSLPFLMALWVAGHTVLSFTIFFGGITQKTLLYAVLSIVLIGLIVVFGRERVFMFVMGALFAVIVFAFALYNQSHFYLAEYQKVLVSDYILWRKLPVTLNLLVDGVNTIVRVFGIGMLFFLLLGNLFPLNVKPRYYVLLGALGALGVSLITLFGLINTFSVSYSLLGWVRTFSAGGVLFLDFLQKVAENLRMLGLKEALVFWVLVILSAVILRLLTVIEASTIVMRRVFGVTREKGAILFMLISIVSAGAFMLAEPQTVIEFINNAFFMLALVELAIAVPYLTPLRKAITAELGAVIFTMLIFALVNLWHALKPTVIALILYAVLALAIGFLTAKR